MKTQQEMANEYGIHRSTFKRRLKLAGIELPKGRISPKYQQLIYDTFGKPMTPKHRLRY